MPITTLETNDVLQWNGTEWRATTILVGIESSTIIAGSAVQGNVLYFNGSKWARLAPGTSGQFLKTQGASADPLWAGAITRAQGLASRAGDAASGTQNIAHGLSSTPTHVRLTAFKSESTEDFFCLSIGVYNGTTTSTVYGIAPANILPTYWGGQDSTNVIRISEDNGGGTEESQVATITVDGTNMVLTWTKTNTPTAATINILWEADF